MDQIIKKIFNKRNLLVSSGFKITSLIIDRNTYDTIINDKKYSYSNITVEEKSEKMLGFKIQIIETEEEIITFDFKGEF